MRIATDIGRPFGALTSSELDRLAAGDIDPGPLTGCHLALLAYWQTYGFAEREQAFACLPVLKGAAATDAGAAAGAAMLLFDEARAGRAGHVRALSEAKEWAANALERAPRRMSARLAGYTAATCAGDSPRFRAVAGAAVRDQPNNPFLLSDVANKSALGFDDWANALPMMERARALNPEPQAWYALTPAVDAMRRNDLPRAVAFLASYEDTPFLQLRLVSLAVAGLMGDTARAKRDIGVIDRPASELMELIGVQCWSKDVQSLLRPAIGKAVSLVR